MMGEQHYLYHYHLYIFFKNKEGIWLRLIRWKNLYVTSTSAYSVTWETISHNAKGIRFPNLYPHQNNNIKWEHFQWLLYIRAHLPCCKWKQNTIHFCVHLYLPSKLQTVEFVRDVEQEPQQMQVCWLTINEDLVPARKWKLSKSFKCTL